MFSIVTEFLQICGQIASALPAEFSIFLAGTVLHMILSLAYHLGVGRGKLEERKAQESRTSSAAVPMSGFGFSAAPTSSSNVTKSSPSSQEAAQLRETSQSALNNLQVPNKPSKTPFSFRRRGQYSAPGEACGNVPEATARIAVIKHMATSGCLDEAFRAFRDFPMKLACLYNAMLDACTDCKDYEAAQKVFNEAVEEEIADVVTYNTMIKAHVQNKELSRARETIVTMRERGLKPNSVTFHELLDSLVRSEKPGAWELLREMKDFGVRPNPITTSILLKSLTAASTPSEVNRAMAIVEEMKDQMDEVLLSSVVEACVRMGRSDLLRKQLNMLRGERHMLIQGAHTYGSLIRAYSSIKEVRGCWEMWNEMLSKSITPTNVTLGCMVEALSSNGDPESGRALIHKMLSESSLRHLVNSVSYCSVIKGFSGQRRFDMVWIVYQEMENEGMSPSVATYNALFLACVRCGRVGRVPHLLEDMLKKGLEPNLISYSSILKGYCQEKQLDRAFELLEHMKSCAKLQPDEVVYNTVLEGCAKQGLYARGMELLIEMQESGVMPSNYTLSILVKMVGRSRDVPLEECFNLSSELTGKHGFKMNIHVYNNMMGACIARGNVSRALEVFTSMHSAKVYPDARTYALLLRACVHDNRHETTADLLRAAYGVECSAEGFLAGFDMKFLKLREGLPDEVLREVSELFVHQCRQQKSELALQLLSELRRIPGLKLDSRLSVRLTVNTIREPNGRR